MEALISVAIVGKFERKRLFWEPEYRWKDIIKLDHRGIKCGAEDWTVSGEAESCQHCN
jgi:hypothetical protein